MSQLASNATGSVAGLAPCHRISGRTRPLPQDQWQDPPPATGSVAGLAPCHRISGRTRPLSQDQWQDLPPATAVVNTSVNGATLQSGGEMNEDIVEQSCSNELNCSFNLKSLRQSQNCFVTDENPRDRNVSLHFTPPPLLCDCSITSPFSLTP